MNLIVWKTQLYNLICTGFLSPDKESVTEEDVNVSLQLLHQAVIEDPALLLDSLTAAVQKNVFGMVVLSMSILLSKADSTYLSAPSTLNAIYFILSYCDAKDLLHLVKNLKYKTFGKGFGSKQQKIVKRVMEAWTVDNLKTLMIIQPKAVYALLRLVHPRFQGERGKLVKDLLNP